jgi:hypothetical protein
MQKVVNRDKLFKFVNVMIILISLFLVPMRISNSKPFLSPFRISYFNYFLRNILFHFNNIVFFSFYTTTAIPCKIDRDCPLSSISQLRSQSKRMRCRKCFCIWKWLYSSKDYMITRSKRIHKRATRLLYEFMFSSCDHPLNEFFVSFSNLIYIVCFVC